MNSSFDYSDDSDHIYYPEYSESPKLNEEFGPESQSSSESESEQVEPIRASQKNEASNTMSSAATFKEQVGKAISRLCNDSIPFCVSGKIEKAPIIAISIPKHKKRLSFPLFERELLNPIIQEFENSPFGTETIVDNNFRNSWQLEHIDFQILNNEWNSYLSEVVMPRIQNDLHLEIGFKLSLRKIWFKTGSFFKSHRDSDKEDGMFGTLFIQLPSSYEGGKLIVRHDHRTDEIDFSTSANAQNEFSMFYTAFYCNCEYEVQPVTSGIQTFLIYNLVSTVKHIEKPLPSGAQTSHQAREADLIELLKNHWPKGQKLVYCLSHKYSRKNLSFENLKTTDRMVAQLFNDYSDHCSLRVTLAVLKRRKSRFVRDVPYVYERVSRHEDYSQRAEVSSVDSDDAEVNFEYTYEIKHIKSLDDCEVLPKMDVDFEREVIPENCFDRVKAFYKDQLDNSLVRAVECMKLYQCAVILIFRHDDLMPILIEGHANEKKMVELYLEEFDKCKNQMPNECVKKKFLKWGHDLLDRYLEYSFDKHDLRNPSKFLDDLLLLDDIELLRKYFQVVKFEVKIIPTLFRMCQKYGWAKFSKQIAGMLCEVRAENRFDFLLKIIEFEDDSNNDPNKGSTLRDIRIAILEKFVSELEDVKSRNSYWCHSRDLNQTIFDNMLLLDDIALLKKYFKLLRFEKNILPILCQMCQNYGWATFSKQIIETFEKMKEYERMDYFKDFIEFQFDNNDVERRSVFQSIMTAIAKRFDYELDHAPRWVKKTEKIEKTKKFLIQLWTIAKELDSSYLVKYAKTKSFEAAVPALIEIAQNTLSNNENNLNNIWIDVANHFKTEMEQTLQRENQAPRTWQLNVKLACTCRDCNLVSNFLNDSYQKTFKFRGIRRRQDHVEENLKGFPLQCSITEKDKLRISKIERTGQPESKIRDFILVFLPQLCLLLPAGNK